MYSVSLRVTNQQGDEMRAIAIRHQGAGDLIKRQPDAKAVYVINHYDKESDSYSCSNYYDMNREIFIKSNKTVYVGFTF